MGIVEYVIIGAAVGGLITIFAALNKKPKKSKSEKPSKKTDANPQKIEKQEPKTEPPAQDNQNVGFKVVKKSRLSRVSKKAIETNSRTAKVEKVFERTPPMSDAQENDIFIDPLDPSNEELLEQLKMLDNPTKKVQSLKELKEQIAMQEQPQQEEYSSAKYITSRAEEQSVGSYTGIHLGRARSAEPEKLEDEQTKSIDMSSIFEDLANRRGRFSSFANFQSQETTKDISSGDIDYSDMVVAEAILNPKYKQHKNFNKNN